MIILMGVAGSGKSMQGRLLADDYGYAWISTGEIFRVLITGKRRQEMLQGKLLSDDEVIRMMDKILDLIDTSEQFVLDGFPRSVAQAEWLSKQIEDGRFKLTAVIHLTASEEVVRERLIKRGRQDDTDEAITERFNEYRNVTVPIIEHFRQEGIPVFDIEAAQEPRTVHEQIMNIVHGE
jgi:adenylate kinase